MEYLVNLFSGSDGAAGFFPYLFAYVVCIAVPFGIFGVYALFAVWMERKVSGHMQSRVGPMRTGGWHGWAQTLADTIKLLLKEDIIPRGVDKFFWLLAPALVFTAAIAGFVALPLANGWIVNDMNLGVFFIVAIGSLEVIGVIMAGWSSNNKWTLFGAIRQAAQVVSYEIPVALTLMVVILMAGSFSLVDIVGAQKGNWFIWQSPWLLMAGVVYFLASLAGCKRAPFDIPEAESELVAGFHTEYSGLRFSFFFMEEYASMLIVSIIFATAFLGGWHLPIVELPFETSYFWMFIGAGIVLAKALLMVFVQMWIRWTLPRMRVDQVMSVAYKYMIPFAFLAIVGAAIFEYYDWNWIPGIF
jgi:NADH-quinone oxidoreductase subunit H